MQAWFRVSSGQAPSQRPACSLEDWQKFAKSGRNVWFYNGRDRKKTGKILRNGHFGLSGLAVSESWLRPWNFGACVTTWLLTLSLVGRGSSVVGAMLQNLGKFVYPTSPN